MLKTVMGQFGTRRTTKIDIIIGIGATVFAALHAADTLKQYKSEQDDINPELNKENIR